mmetsp:Transcript_46421/g.108336  ORF Transcript_46421/g.108336 Transcript_46421/m.108336 type:complete len:513 (+) Transcript_46421:337-1875(+)
MSIRNTIYDRRASRATVVAASGTASSAALPIPPLPPFDPDYASWVHEARRIAPGARLTHTLLTAILAFIVLSGGNGLLGTLLFAVLIGHAVLSWALAWRIARLPVPCLASAATDKPRRSASKASFSAVTETMDATGVTSAPRNNAMLERNDAIMERSDTRMDASGGVVPPSDEEAAMDSERSAPLFFMLRFGLIASPVIDFYIATHAMNFYIREPSIGARVPKELISEAQADADKGDAEGGGYLLRSLATRRAPVHLLLEAIPSGVLAAAAMVAQAAPPNLCLAIILSAIIHAIAHINMASRVATMLGGWPAYIEEVLMTGRGYAVFSSLPLLQLYAGTAHTPLVGSQALATAERTAQLATALIASPWITAVRIDETWLPMPREVRPRGPNSMKLNGLRLSDTHTRLLAAVMASSAATESTLDLRVISLARNKIGDSGAAALAALCAARGATIRALDLNDNHISNIGAGALAAGAIRGGVLVTLNLNHNRVARSLHWTTTTHSVAIALQLAF